MEKGADSPPALPLGTKELRDAALLFFVGLSIALGVWECSHPSLLPEYLLHNRISAEDRRSLLLLLLSGALGILVVAAAFAAWQGREAVHRAAARMGPLLVVGLLPPLARYQLWVGRDVVFLIAVLATALTFGLMLRRPLAGRLYSFKKIAFGLPTWPRASVWKNRLLTNRGGLWCVVVGALCYAVYFSISTINNHNNFGTSAFDLGIENNLVFNAIHFGPLFRSAPLGGSMLHGGYHQTYFAYLIGPIYALMPRAETLLVIQSTFLGAAAVPLYLVAVPRIGSLRAVFLCFCFLLYAPLHGANLYDFHYQPFGVFFTLLLAYLLDSGKSWRALLPVLLVMLSVREDMGAMAGSLGGFFLFTGKRPRDALLLAFLGSLYFVTMKLYIMPQVFMNGQSSFAFIYKLLIPEGETGFGGVLKTAIGNPLYTLDTLLVQQKLRYLLELFVPVCLIALRRAPTLLLFLPGFVFTLLSTEYPPLTMTSFQYTSYWSPMIFLATVFALGNMQTPMSAPAATAAGPRAPLAGMTAKLLAIGLATALTSLRYGAVLQVELARGAHDPVHLRPTEEGKKNYADFQALAKQLPRDAKVAASEWLVPHVSNRIDAYSLRNGVADAEYILFWLHPTKSRVDERPVLLDVLSTNRRYGVVDRRGMFVLAKLGHEPSGRLENRLRREINRAGKGLPPLPPEKPRPARSNPLRSTPRAKPPHATPSPPASPAPAPSPTR